MWLSIAYIKIWKSFAPDMASNTSYDKEYFHAKRRDGEKEKRKKSIFRRYLVHVIDLGSRTRG